MPNSLIVALEAQIAQFSAAMEGAARQLDKIERPAARGAQAVRQVQYSMRALAAEALQIPGPLGRVTGLLVELGGFRTLGVTAAMAAFYKITVDAEKRVGTLIAETEKLDATLAGVVGGRAATLARLGDLGEQLQRQQAIAAGDVSKGFFDWFATHNPVTIATQPLLTGTPLGMSAEGLARMQLASTAAARLQEIIAAITKEMDNQQAIETETRALNREEIAGLAQQVHLADQRRTLQERIKALQQAQLGLQQQQTTSEGQGLRLAELRYQVEEKLRRLQALAGTRPTTATDRVPRSIVQAGGQLRFMDQQLADVLHGVPFEPFTSVRARGHGRVPVPTPTTTVGVQGPVMTAIQEEVEAQRHRAQMIEGLRAAEQNATLSTVERAAASKLLKQALDQERAGAVGAAMALQAAGNIAIGLITAIQSHQNAGGIFGGLLQGVGGALMLAKGVDPLLGVGLSVGGGLISALSSHQQEPVPVYDAALERAVNKQSRASPDVFQIKLVDTRTGVEEIIWEQSRKSREDAIVRLPPVVFR